MADRMTTEPLVIDQQKGDDWHLWQGDCVEVSRGIPDNSVGFTVYSPPFASLYTFSDDPRDVSNNTTSEVFFAHYRFLIDQIFRVTMPGRLCAVHCMQLPASITRDGFIGIHDFRGQIVQAHRDAGWYFHSEVMIRKDPVSAMQRSKSIGLLHKQVKKDSALSRMALADYVVVFRKPGVNPEPVAGLLDDEYLAEKIPRDYVDWQGMRRPHTAETKSIAVWQRYAESVWLDIAQSDTLSRKLAREEADEAHISPLQLTVIRRCCDLWSNPGDVVFSPFAGIGSELYVAVEMGRRAIGIELKESYFRQAVANMRTLVTAQPTLFAAQ